ncbi:uncharacterized protein BP01DRAFT_199746 [Aspergillus saccharolyticus JOP 1030-1]|uniref:Uncharacterized protein n=1 Tax=Aspergillus saccharolyticus JOP 1030-1 TaxID=1450539 RepID=A0A319A7Y5_9EURO|nr:hypothetical protein BP01DRAFT_199746 [Aspergillus saccharolyticus JOP 1030-1]PYH47888.1 hypothetical protein BP01DRAFT_199746 [Aspergillus saccharolyticus JOP 1030-1]
MRDAKSNHQIEDLWLLLLLCRQLLVKALPPKPPRVKAQTTPTTTTTTPDWLPDKLTRLLQTRQKNPSPRSSSMRQLGAGDRPVERDLSEKSEVVVP